MVFLFGIATLLFIFTAFSLLLLLLKDIFNDLVNLELSLDVDLTLLIEGGVEEDSLLATTLVTPTAFPSLFGFIFEADDESFIFDRIPL